MANLNTAYSLSRVADQRGFLGVSKDEDGFAVISVGKNMVIRCRLSDQKEVKCWNTTLVRLSSKVIYNPEDKKYTGVFDNIYIKQWEENESSLEKIKKKKLRSEIHEALPHKILDSNKLTLIVLYKNGSCEELNSALEKDTENIVGILQKNDVIQKANIISTQEDDYLIIVTKIEDGTTSSPNKGNKGEKVVEKYTCHSVKLQSKNYTISSEPVTKLKLRRQGAVLLGHCVFKRENENCLITFWSDGFLYSLPLPLQSEKDGLGNFIGTLEMASQKSSLAMIQISSSHLAFYAAGSSQEGAVLGIYNVEFKMTQAHSNFKMFNEPPRMWLIDKYLIFIMGQNLMCVPFDLQTETLSALVGSRALYQNIKESGDICPIMPTACWESEEVQSIDDEMDNDCPFKVKEQLEFMAAEGLPESGISEILLTQLMENKDINTIYWCLRKFIDIPEHILVKVLSLAMSEPDSSFKDISVADSYETDSKSHFLFTLFTVPVDKVNLLNSLRIHLKFEEGLSLFKFFSSFVSLRNDESDANLLNWVITLLDAFYQQFILSRDPQVLDSILLLREKIDSQISILNEFKKLQPILIRLKSKKELFKKQGHSKNYYVEKLQLYQ